MRFEPGGVRCILFGIVRYIFGENSLVAYCMLKLLDSVLGICIFLILCPLVVLFSCIVFAEFLSVRVWFSCFRILTVCVLFITTHPPPISPSSPRLLSIPPPSPCRSRVRVPMREQMNLINRLCLIDYVCITDVPLEVSSF